MGVLSQGNIRVSLPWDTRREDVEHFLEVLPGAVRIARPEPETTGSTMPTAPTVQKTSLTIDALGKLCPLPVIELGKRIGDVPVGAVVRVLADDPAARLDIPAWCRMTGQDFLGTEPIEGGRPESALGYLVGRLH
jgi:cysteine desulfurase